MPKPAPGQSPLYSGTFDCAKKIFLKEVFIIKMIDYDVICNVKLA